MRNAFIEELVLAAKNGKEVALIVGDLGHKVVEPFADLFPERFFNAGIAEQNMAGIAAGMASEGLHVFVYSIANFPIFRCAEQIRNDIDYHQLPVTIVTVGGGLAYGNLGYSHHAIQDYAFMRTMPNMMLASPGDPMEVRGAMRYLLKNPQPSYLRLGKAGEHNFHLEPPNLEPGNWLPIPTKSGVKGHSAKCFLTTGCCIGIADNYVLESEKFKDYQILSMPLWSMKAKDRQKDFISTYDEIITIEDHLEDGGFGSWLMESVNKEIDLRNRIKSLSLSAAVCGSVGSQAALNRLGGLMSLEHSIWKSAEDQKN